MVQDISASIPVHLFNDVKGKSALDLCAAPGGENYAVIRGWLVTAVDMSKV